MEEEDKEGAVEEDEEDVDGEDIDALFIMDHHFTLA